MNGWTYFTVGGSLLLVVAEVAFQVAVLGAIVVRGRTSPAVRLAWLIVVVVLPVIGPLLYLRLGRVPLRDRVAKQQSLRRQCSISTMTIMFNSLIWHQLMTLHWALKPA